MRDLRRTKMRVIFFAFTLILISNYSNAMDVNEDDVIRKFLCSMRTHAANLSGDKLFAAVKLNNMETEYGFLWGFANDSYTTNTAKLDGIIIVYTDWNLYSLKHGLPQFLAQEKKIEGDVKNVKIVEKYIESTRETWKKEGGLKKSKSTKPNSNSSGMYFDSKKSNGSDVAPTAPKQKPTNEVSLALKKNPPKENIPTENLPRPSLKIETNEQVTLEECREALKALIKVAHGRLSALPIKSESKPKNNSNTSKGCIIF